MDQSLPFWLTIGRFELWSSLLTSVTLIVVLQQLHLLLFNQSFISWHKENKLKSNYVFFFLNNVKNNIWINQVDVRLCKKGSPARSSCYGPRDQVYPNSFHYHYGNTSIIITAVLLFIDYYHYSNTSIIITVMLYYNYSNTLMWIQ